MKVHVFKFSLGTSLWMHFTSPLNDLHDSGRPPTGRCRRPWRKRTALHRPGQYRPHIDRFRVRQAFAYAFPALNSSRPQLSTSLSKAKVNQPRCDFVLRVPCSVEFVVDRTFLYAMKRFHFSSVVTRQKAPWRVVFFYSAYETVILIFRENCRICKLSYF